MCLYESVRSSGTGVRDNCELPCRCWQLNPGPPEEQTVLYHLAISAALTIIFLNLKNFIFMCMYLHEFVCTTWVQDPAEVRRFWIPGVTGGFELPKRCKEPNSVLLQAQQVFLTISHLSSAPPPSF